jgi:hypothetical protein
MLKRGVVAATDGGIGAPEASPATTPGGAPGRLEPGAPHTTTRPYACPICKGPLEVIDFCADFSGHRVEVTDLYRCPQDGWQGFVAWKDGVLVPSTGVVASG